MNKDKGTPMALIELNHVEKRYPSAGEDLIIFQNVQCQVNEGESLVITGESGCGKSTLLNLIGGLDKPSAGTVNACGYEVSRLSEKGLTTFRSLVVGFIFQFHYLLKDFTALENVMLPAVMAGLSRKDARERAEALVADVKLQDRCSHFPVQLSGGERQRIALARSLINNPRLILADEPTGNLDEGNSRVVEEILFELVDRYKKTLLLVTHDQRLALRGQRKLLLHNKELVEA